MAYHVYQICNNDSDFSLQLPRPPNMEQNIMKYQDCNVW